MPLLLRGSIPTCVGSPCSASVNLPRENYSDHATSGVSEDDGRAFGFGTFDAKKITDGEWYYNDIYLKESFYYEQWSDGYPLLGWNVYPLSLTALPAAVPGVSLVVKRVPRFSYLALFRTCESAAKSELSRGICKPKST